jgi:hypothetical protein
MSPSLSDGFNGARDAAIFKQADIRCNHARIQCTDRTRDLLHRANIPRPMRGQFYSVPVAFNSKLDRHEIACPAAILN